MSKKTNKFFDYITDPENNRKVLVWGIVLLTLALTVNFVNYYNAASKEYAAREAHYEVARETLKILKSMEEKQ